jgi:hypothetical protein
VKREACFSGIKGKQIKKQTPFGSEPSIERLGPQVLRVEDRVLCASAVRIILSKTLLGSPFKPPFLGVVVDFSS